MPRECPWLLVVVAWIWPLVSLSFQSHLSCCSHRCGYLPCISRYTSHCCLRLHFPASFHLARNALGSEQCKMDNIRKLPGTVTMIQHGDMEMHPELYLQLQKQLATSGTGGHAHAHSHVHMQYLDCFEVGIAQAVQPLSLGSESPSLVLNSPSFRMNSPSSKKSGGCPGSDELGLEELDRSVAGGSSYQRWPRQETLALIKIRSEMDSRFRDASQKAPLWEEVSRGLAVLGYHRSAKKCREKFENLYKYYKKTKEGRAGRQDGKLYRFFGQLEALYGSTTENCTSGTRITDVTEISAKSHEDFSFDSSSYSSFSEGEQEVEKNTVKTSKRKRKSNWKCKMKSYFKSAIKEFMDRQEVWLKKVLETLDNKEQERVAKEEAWRRRENERLDREHHLWTMEHQRLHALITALEKINAEALTLLNNDSHNFKLKHSDPNSQSSEEISNAKSTNGLDQAPKIWKEKCESFCKNLKNRTDSNLNRAPNTSSYFQEEIAVCSSTTSVSASIPSTSSNPASLTCNGVTNFDNICSSTSSGVNFLPNYFPGST